MPKPVPQTCIACPVPYTPGASADAARIVTFLGEMAKQKQSVVLDPDQCRLLWEYAAAMVQDLMLFTGWEE
jgi:hypothetical protein